jgi:hypothetical protein
MDLGEKFGRLWERLLGRDYQEPTATPPPPARRRNQRKGIARDPAGARAIWGHGPWAPSVVQDSGHWHANGARGAELHCTCLRLPVRFLARTGRCAPLRREAGWRVKVRVLVKVAVHGEIGCRK